MDIKEKKRLESNFLFFMQKKNKYASKKKIKAKK
jgi:hypothetical protein